MYGKIIACKLSSIIKSLLGLILNIKHEISSCSRYLEPVSHFFYAFQWCSCSYAGAPTLSLSTKTWVDVGTSIPVSFAWSATNRHFLLYCPAINYLSPLTSNNTTQFTKFISNCSVLVYQWSLSVSFSYLFTNQCYFTKHSTQYFVLNRIKQKQKNLITSLLCTKA